MTSIDFNSLKILYDDSNLVAVDKPVGIASISESDTSIQTIHSLLEKKYSAKVFIVHRIDKEVSGIILFARNSSTHKYLNQLFAERVIKKNYTALVHGLIDEDYGLINKPIREFGSGRMGVDEKKGKPSKTEFRVIKRFEEFTLLDVSIITGRRHQIRVHLYSTGHSIVGDLRYGNKIIQEQYPRLMLHANRIELPLQDRSHKIIESALPDDFTKFLDKLE